MLFAESAQFAPRPLEGVDLPLEVVFIGDDPAIADMYQLKLQLDGYAVTLVTTEQARSDALSIPTPDLVYLDLGLLNPASLAMYRSLRARPSTKHLPIVLLSNQFTRDAPTGLKLSIRDLFISNDTTRQGSYWSEYPELMLARH